MNELRERIELIIIITIIVIIDMEIMNLNQVTMKQEKFKNQLE